MKNRRPTIIAMPPRAADPSQDVDAAYFRRHPEARVYERDALPGELPEAMPPGTRVWVRRVGIQRIRGFIPPKEGLN